MKIQNFAGILFALCLSVPSFANRALKQEIYQLATEIRATVFETNANKPQLEEAKNKLTSVLSVLEGDKPTPPLTGNEEFHMLGIYEPRALPIKVTVNSKKPVILLLTAYERTTWEIVGDKKRVKFVILSGYDKQRVKGVPEYLVHSYGGYEEEKLGAFYTYREDDANYKKITAAIYERYGLTPDTFQGSYSGTKFTVGDAE